MNNMKKYRKIIYVFIFAILFLLIGTKNTKAVDLYLNNLNFDVHINSDGSMDVKEIWDIKIYDTNTLYKEFKTDSSKYSGITNVVVKEITGGTDNYFTKIDNWAYHAPKNSYYGTNNKSGNFEIGWGVGLENKTSTRKYEISYTVKDAITKYNDYAELYWQFIGKDFEIDAKKITGTIYLPSNVSSKDEIKVWGHSEDLNGTIYATDLNKIEFDMNDFRSGRYVEIRTLFPSKIIESSGRIKNTNILELAVQEETKWANDANERREREKQIRKIFGIFIIGVYILFNVILVLVFIKKMKKYSKLNKELKKYTLTQDIKYYRDLPDEMATPGEAVNTLDIDTCIYGYTPNNFGKIFSATILDLTLKKHLDINLEKNGRKEVIKIAILENNENDIKADEEHILSFIGKAAKGKNELTLDELKKYIQKNPTKVENLLKENYKKSNQQLINSKIIDGVQQKEYKRIKENVVSYSIIAFLLYCFVFIIPAILCTIDAVLVGKVAKKINVLTQDGIDNQAKWNGLKKYMEEFSLLNEREVPELAIWEKYLVFATAFGIADKVIKQLKIVYPNFDEMTNNLSSYTYMNIMMHTNFSTSFSSSITSSMSMAYSSGSGGGGGFSGGGGFGRRPEEAEAGR